MEIEKLAKLARISLSSEEKEKLQKEFEAILGYISKLNEADLSLPETKKMPTVHENKNILRNDENAHKAGEFTKDLLEAAPFVEGGYVKVKHVFE